MMSRKFSSIALCVIMLFSMAATVTAYESTPPGIYHEDGSYQFSEGELKRLNAFDAKAKQKNTEATHASMLLQCAPQYYNTLSNEVKTYLSQTAYTDHVDNSMAQSIRSGNAVSSTISKYGISLKGVSTTQRQPVGYAEPCFVSAYNEIRDDRGVRRTYSENIEYYPPGTLIGTVSATSIADLPTGYYHCYGTHLWPTWNGYALVLDGCSSSCNPIFNYNP